jgi:hypothetical protein
MTLYQLLWLCMDERHMIMEGEYTGMWEEAVETYFKVISRLPLEDAEVNNDNRQCSKDGPIPVGIWPRSSLMRVAVPLC